MGMNKIWSRFETIPSLALEYIARNTKKRPSGNSGRDDPSTQRLIYFEVIKVEGDLVSYGY